MVAGSNPDEVIGFFNWPNRSSLTMALGSTQRLTKISTRNLPGGKGRPARKADNLTAICGSLDVTQPCGPPRPVICITLLFYTCLCIYISSRNMYCVTETCLSNKICSRSMCPDIYTICRIQESYSDLWRCHANCSHQTILWCHTGIRPRKYWRVCMD
jgi:hypothetical protein